MALITTCSGAYVATYQRRDRAALGTAVTMGVTREGYALGWTTHEHRVNDTTTFGQTLIEGIYLGADWTIAFTAREYLVRANLEFAYPWGVSSGRNAAQALGGTPDPTWPVKLGRVGRRMTNQAGILALVATAGTPAAGSPATLIAQFAIMASGQQYSWKMDSTLREIPCKGVLLPYQGAYSEADGGGRENIHFQTT